MPGRREGEDAEQGEVEAGESGGEEGGGGAGAEERTVGPAGGEAASVIGVHMSQEVGLTPTLPPVHRYQTALHLCYFDSDFFRPLSVSNRASFSRRRQHYLGRFYWAYCNWFFLMGLLYCIKAHYNCFTNLLVIIFRQNYNLFRLCIMKCRIIAQIRKPPPPLPEERSVGERRRRRLVAVTLRMKMNVFLSVSPRILPLDFDFVCSLTLGLYVRRG